MDVLEIPNESWKVYCNSHVTQEWGKIMMHMQITCTLCDELGIFPAENSKNDWIHIPTKKVTL